MTKIVYVLLSAGAAIIGVLGGLVTLKMVGGT
jgi:hypothetical protein